MKVADESKEGDFIYHWNNQRTEIPEVLVSWKYLKAIHKVKLFLLAKVYFNIQDQITKSW
jgi:hypothetical protein